MLGSEHSFERRALMIRSSAQLIGLTTALGLAFAAQATSIIGCSGAGTSLGPANESGGTGGSQANSSLGGPAGQKPSAGGRDAAGGNVASGGNSIPSSSTDQPASPTTGAGGGRVGGVAGGSAAGGRAVTDAGSAGAGGAMSSDAAGTASPAGPDPLPVSVKPWAPSQRCKDKASQLVSAMSRANKAAQMVQADSFKVQPAQASSANLGSVLSGGGIRPRTRQ